jgi:hypothetical protein
MDTVVTQTVADQPPFPTRTLWRALLAIHNQFLVERIGLLRLGLQEPGMPPGVADAMLLLDCWLDVAIAEDWFGSTEVEP